MMERNYKLPKEGGLEPGADPADIIRKFEKITRITVNCESI